MTHYDSVPGQASGLSQSPAEINMMGGLKSAASLPHFTSTSVRLHNVQRRSGSFRPDGLATTGVWTGAPLHPHLGAPPNDNQLELRWAPSSLPLSWKLTSLPLLAQKVTYIPKKVLKSQKSATQQQQPGAFRWALSLETHHPPIVGLESPIPLFVHRLSTHRTSHHGNRHSRLPSSKTDSQRNLLLEKYF